MSDEDNGLVLNFHRNESVEIIYPNKRKIIKSVGNYILGNKIGEGSYSKVKEAVDKCTLERRAIKIMRRQRLKKIPNGEQNVKKEIELLYRLDHKNVVKLIEKIYCKEKEKLYIVMEYCYMVLHELIESLPGKKFPIWQSHRYFTQLLDGLEYLHSQGVVHNDIKPGNLLINSQEIVKISDFGVSQLLDKFDKTDFCVQSQGTPTFQPPEIAQGQDQFHGFKVDVWASGITLFKFVNGDYPFKGDTLFILFENISKAELEIPNDLDDLLQSLLKGLLEKDADKRFSIDDAKNHHWVRRTYPKYGEEEVKLDERFLKPTSVLPYLKNLHNPESKTKNKTEDEYDDDYDNESENKKHCRTYEQKFDPEIELQKEFWRYTKLTIEDINEFRLKNSLSAQDESTSNDGCSFLNLSRKSDLSGSKRSIFKNMKDNCNQS